MTTNDVVAIPQSWTADAQAIVFAAVTRGGSDPRLLSLGSEPRSEGLIETEFNEVFAQVSPDGRWVAYTSDESGQSEVYVRPFPNVEEGRWQISRDGGIWPAWGGEGVELFFNRIGSADMMVVRVDADPTFSPGNPEVLFEAPFLAQRAFRGRPWDPAPDGRFLMVNDGGAEGQAGAPHIVVVLNWFSELGRLVSTN